MKQLALVLIFLHVWMSVSFAMEYAGSGKNTVDELQELYPDRTIYVVTLEEYQQLQAALRTDSTIDLRTIFARDEFYTSLAELQEPLQSDRKPGEDSDEVEEKEALEQETVADRNEGVPSEIKEETEKEPLKEPEAKDPDKIDRKDDDEKEDRVRGNTSVTISNPGGCGDLDSCFDVGGDGAALLFVVIGVFVVAAFFVFAVKYFYDVATNYDQYEYWWEVGLNVTGLSRKERSGSTERGIMEGIKFSTGFIDRHYHIGLTGEIGYLDLHLKFENNTSLYDLKGVYGVIGPAIRLYIDDEDHPSYLYLELLAGTSEPREIGLISFARAGFSVGLNNHVRLGLNVGSVYVDLQENEGFIRETSDFNVIGGLECAFRF